MTDRRGIEGEIEGGIEGWSEGGSVRWDLASSED